MFTSAGRGVDETSLAFPPLPFCSTIPSRLRPAFALQMMPLGSESLVTLPCLSGAVCSFCSLAMPCRQQICKSDLSFGVSSLGRFDSLFVHLGCCPPNSLVIAPFLAWKLRLIPRAKQCQIRGSHQYIFVDLCDVYDTYILLPHSCFLEGRIFRVCKWEKTSRPSAFCSWTFIIPPSPHRPNPQFCWSWVSQSQGRRLVYLLEDK